jgi:hypothetical protein
VEVMGYSNEEDSVPKEFELLKFQDSKHLLRAALICPELASIKIKKEVWQEFNWYTTRDLVASVKSSRNRLQIDQMALDSYLADPENWESNLVNSMKFKNMLMDLKTTRIYNMTPGQVKIIRMHSPNFVGPHPLVKRKKSE